MILEMLALGGLSDLYGNSKEKEERGPISDSDDMVKGDASNDLTGEDNSSYVLSPKKRKLSQEEGAHIRKESPKKKRRVENAGQSIGPQSNSKSQKTPIESNPFSDDEIPDEEGSSDYLIQLTNKNRRKKSLRGGYECD
jgi:hypothetical protein